MKIGIYDSGIGGLSVLHQARKMLPDAEFLYYADEKHVPYGEKTREEIKGYVEEILNFLIDHGVDAVVIACNTATSVAKKNFAIPFPFRSWEWNRRSIKPCGCSRMKQNAFLLRQLRSRSTERNLII